MLKTGSKFWLFVFLGMFCSFSITSGATFNVNTVSDLDSALKAAESNGEDDVINVAPGVYQVSSTLEYTTNDGDHAGSLNGHTLTIIGAGVGSTILDGGGACQVLNINTDADSDGGDEGGDVTIKGITVQNGYASTGDGGGVYIYTDSANISIESCSFSSNEAYTGAGGGISITTTFGAVLIKYSAFVSNFSEHEGAGVHAYSFQGLVRLVANVFSENKSYDLGSGAYIYCGLGGSVNASDDVFVSNDCEYRGGGIFVRSFNSSETILTNNTFSADSALYGGGAYIELNGDQACFKAYNNIFWGNTANGTGNDGDDLYVESDKDSNGTGAPVYLYNNDFSGNANFTTGQGEDLEITDTDNYMHGNNIQNDPLFVGSGNYHLSSGSPCVDVGDNTAPNLPEDDYESNPRKIDGNNDSVATVDMGADEYSPTITYSILHKEGAIWSSDSGWELDTPPYYSGIDYARDVEFRRDGSFVILHKDGAVFDSTSSTWNLSSPPYYSGSAYAKDLELKSDGTYTILHKYGALWNSGSGWILTSPPYYSGVDYARALELRADDSYVILHKEGAVYDSSSGWVLTTPPYYPGSDWVVDIKLTNGGYKILHRDGALWDSASGWELSSPPYYSNSDYARALELRSGGGYVILHKEGALYDSKTGWILNTPPYYPNTDWAVDIELR